MNPALVKGSTSVSVYVFVKDSSVTTGVGLPGLVFNSGSLTCYYVRPLSVAVAVTLITQTVTGAYASGGFVEVDATNMPGLYRLDLPDAALASGVDTVTVLLQGATNMTPVEEQIQLTTFDLNATAPDVNVLSLSGDAAAADNLEAMYDGTGYADGFAPATQDQIGTLSSGGSSALNFPVSADNTAGAIIDGVVFVGTQVGTFANIEANLTTFHQINDVGNAFDIVYRIACGATRTATAIQIDNYLNSNNDVSDILVFDHVGLVWDTVLELTGQVGAGINENAIPIFEKHTGAVGTPEAGNVYLRFETSGQTAPILFNARIVATAVAATSTMGYEGGLVYVDESNGLSSGISQGIDGTFANQSDDFDNGQTIADNLGTANIVVHPGNTITLTAALMGYVLIGKQAVITGGGQSVDSTRFEGGVYNGIWDYSGSGSQPVWSEANMTTGTYDRHVFLGCGVVGTITLGQAGVISVWGTCFPAGPLVVDFNGLATTLKLESWSGNITINGMVSGSTLDIHCSSGGLITLNGADATVNISGPVEAVVNNLTGSPTVTNNGLSLASINTEVDTAISDAALATAASIAALNDLSAAQVNTEVDTAITDATLATAANLATVDTVVDAIKVKTDTLPVGIIKNQAFNNFEFLMVLSSDHVTGAPGLTVSATRSLDGGVFGATANAPTEVSSGVYKIDLAASDLNADSVTFLFTAATADGRFITVITQPGT